MAKTKNGLPRWAEILLGTFIVGGLIWALVPKEILYLSIGIAVVIVSGVSYLIYRKGGIESFIRFGKKVLEAMTAPEHKRKPVRTPIPADRQRAVLARADHRCQHQDCGRTANLWIHHIDGDRTNHDHNNLIVLCREHAANADKRVYRIEQLKAWMRRPGPSRYVGKR